MVNCVSEVFALYTVFLEGTQKSEMLLSTVLADIQEMLMVTERGVVT